MQKKTHIHLNACSCFLFSVFVGSFFAFLSQVVGGNFLAHIVDAQWNHPNWSWELLGKAHRQIRFHGVIDCYSLVTPRDREASHHNFSRLYFLEGRGLLSCLWRETLLVGLLKHSFSLFYIIPFHSNCSYCLFFGIYLDLLFFG